MYIIIYQSIAAPAVATAAGTTAAGYAPSLATEVPRIYKISTVEYNFPSRTLVVCRRAYDGVLCQLLNLVRKCNDGRALRSRFWRRCCSVHFRDLGQSLAFSEVLVGQANVFCKQPSWRGEKHVSYLGIFRCSHQPRPEQQEKHK